MTLNGENLTVLLRQSETLCGWFDKDDAKITSDEMLSYAKNARESIEENLEQTEKFVAREKRKKKSRRYKIRQGEQFATQLKKIIEKMNQRIEEYGESLGDGKSLN